MSAGTGTDRARSLGRWATGALLVSAGVALVTVWSTRCRHAEAWLVSLTVGAFAPTLLDGYALRVASSGGEGRWFVVTPACSAALLAAPLLVFAAWAVLQHRFRVPVVLGGLVAGALVLVGLGTVRMTTIGLAWLLWGDASLWVTHTFVGTLISIAASLAALGAQALVIGRRTPTAARQFGTA